MYHSDELIGMMLKYPGHDFNKLAILHDRDLLDELFALVTTDPMEGAMDQTYGVPPHVKHALQLADLCEKMVTLMEGEKERNKELVKTVNEVIEKKLWESGHVSGERFKNMLDEYKAESIGKISDRMEEIKKIVNELSKKQTSNNSDDDVSVPEDDNNELEIDGSKKKFTIFQYKGRFYGVLESFNFLSCTLKQGLQFWLFGQSASITRDCVVRPFQMLSTKLLPLTLKNKFKINWCPIFRYIGTNGAVKLSRNTTTMSKNEFKEYYTKCVEMLRDRVSYVFQKKGERNTLTLSVAMWSRLIQKSSIIKNGNAHDNSFITRAIPISQRAFGASRKRTLAERSRFIGRHQRRGNRKGDHEGNDTGNFLGNRLENHMGNHRNVLEDCSDEEKRDIAIIETRNNEQSSVQTANAVPTPNLFLSKVSNFSSIVMTPHMIAREEELKRLMTEAEESKDNAPVQKSTTQRTIVPTVPQNRGDSAAISCKGIFCTIGKCVKEYFF